MSIFSGARIVDNGIVFHLDAANNKSLDRSENFLTYSQEFDNAIWNKNNCSVTANDVIAPDGTLTADKITATVNDDVFVDNTYTASYNTTPLTYSIFAKAGTYRYIAIQSFVNIWSKTLVFDLQTGTAVTPFYPNDGRTWSIVAYPNGWYRCIVTYPKDYYYYFLFRFALTNYVGPADAGIDSTTSPAVGQYIYVWGAQIERGIGATDYYTTTSVAKNRTTTLIDLTGNASTVTLTNGPYFDFTKNGSIQFDGTNDFATINKPITSAFSEMTIELVCSSSVAGNSGSAYLLWDHTGGNPMWLGKSQGNEWYWFWNYNGGRGKSAQISSTNYVANTWVHVTVRAYLSNTTRIAETNNFAELIVNGSSYSTTHRNDSDLSLNFPATSIYLARKAGAAGNGELGGTVADYANVNIALFKIYNRVLNRDEVKQNFEAIRGRFGI